MQHDEEAPPNEQDQHFEETVYVPAGGGWKTLLIISLILIALGVYLTLGGDEPNQLGSVVCFAGIIGLVFTWKGVTFIHPNQAVLLTYATKYQGTMKQNGVFWTNPLFTK